MCGMPKTTCVMVYLCFVGYAVNSLIVMNASDDQHEIFRRDPAELIQYVHCRVKVATIDGKQHIGWVYTIDPVSSTIVLMQYIIDINTKQLTRTNHAELILGHAVRSIEVLERGDLVLQADMDAMFKFSGNANAICGEEMARRCERLQQWLEQNRVPVGKAENRPDVLTIGGDVLTIEPPYSVDSCLSTNEIILSRVQSLIKSMPVVNK